MKFRQDNVIIHQGILYDSLKKLFPNFEISINSRKQATFRNPHSKLYCEIDIWIRELSICFEFQDSYHYVTSWYSHNPIQNIQNCDYIKSELVRLKKGTLVVVPCWWDGNLESLKALINFHRPELQHLFDTSNDRCFGPPNVFNSFPISLNPSDSFFEKPQVPDIGELMLASYPSDGKKYLLDDNSWWFGEKYDGVRCCWHPKAKALYSRAGIKLHLLPQFNRHFPTIFLDGELWFGRGNFTETQRIVSATLFTEFQSLRVIAFDQAIPQNEMGSTIENRYHTLLSNISCDSTFMIIPVRINYCENYINEFVYKIMNFGGEGIILQSCNSAYSHGRSFHLFKLKASQEDQEGLVVYSNKTEGVQITLATGELITLQPENILHLRPTPKVGDIITCSYNASNNLRKVSPNNIQALHIRSDITWKDALYSFHSSSHLLNESSKISTQPTPHNHLLLDPLWQDVADRRAWFDKHARTHGLDPLNPDDWYDITFSNTTQLNQILAYYSGSIEQALLHLFPEIGLDTRRFDKAYWNDSSNRVAFFMNFAKRQDFDPLIASNWYYVTKSDIMSQKGGSAVLNYYSGSPKRALLHLFPHIGLQDSLFVHVSKNHWEIKSNQRSFFEEFAASQNFSPQVVENWYKTVQHAILAKKGGSRILAHYGFSFKKALQHLFPELTFDSNKFTKLPRNHWNTHENRKAFFVHFANSKGFEPNIAKNWYSISRDMILSAKGGNSVLKYYNGSHKRALQQVFPNIGLTSSHFSH